MSENTRLRSLVWSMHHREGDGHGLYGDDGELQCSSPDGGCDFKNATIEQIEDHIHRRGLRLWREGAAVPAAPFVEIEPSDIARVYEHACDSPTCPACKPEPAPEPTLIEGHPFQFHYSGVDACGYFGPKGYCRARTAAHKAPSAAKEGR